ncbi:MAG: nucleoside deaminase [Terriglobales bacterium]
MSDQEWLRLACEKAREGIAAGQSPFGAVIVRAGEVVAAAHNTVWRDTDPTAHAEVNAIRQAARALQQVELSGCELFSSCEPCPMCLSAIHWAKLDRVVFAATIEDAAAAGFSELRVSAKELARMGGSPLVVEVAASREEGRTLFDLWRQAGGRSY